MIFKSKNKSKKKTKFDTFHDVHENFSLKKYMYNLYPKEEIICSNRLYNLINADFDIWNFLIENDFEMVHEAIFTNQEHYHFYNKKMKCGFILHKSLGSKNNETPIPMEAEYEEDESLGIDETEYGLDNGYYLMSGKDYFNNLFKIVESHFKPAIIKRTINFLAKDQSGFRLNRIALDKKLEIDFNLNYNDNFEFERVQNYIDEKINGLILLGGLAGSGKTYYIKYLVHNMERSFLYIPNQYVDLLTSPEFINFAIERLKDYVLILEDGENVLISRDLVKTSAVPTILNLTDGIVGDILNLTIICTYNTKDKIDTALFRKGRLLYEYHFDKLNVDKCNELSKKLGYNIEYTEDTSLAEVYNIEDNGIKTPTTKMGY